MKKEGKYLIYNTPRQRKTIKQAIKYMLYVAYFALCKVILMFYREAENVLNEIEKI